MSTHDFARILEHLVEGLGVALKSEAAKGFGEVATALRSEPEQALKDFLKQIRGAASGKATAQGGSKAAELVERIRAVREGRDESAGEVIAATDKLKLAELKEVLKAFGVSGKRTLVENKALVRGLMGSQGTSGDQTSPDLSEDDVFRMFCQLKDSQGFSIGEIRQRFEVIRQQPKAVLENLARRLGYHFDGGKDEIASRLLQTLEGMRLSEMRGEAIGGS